MVPIPTEPIPVVVITVPPVPTVILSPAVKRPSSNVNLVSVSKSVDPKETNNISFSFPGGVNLTVTATPGFGRPIPSAVIACPTKFNCVVLLNPPTSAPSSKTLILPGMIPP